MREIVSVQQLATFGDEDTMQALWPLSFDQLEKVRKFAGRVLEEKYDRNHGPPKYGNLPRHFSKRQLFEFFDAITSRELYLAFLIQFAFGLRVGELRRLDYLEKQELLRVDNAKAGRVEYLPVYEAVKSPLRAYLSSDKYSYAKLRKYFRCVCEDAGDEFTYVYGMSSHKENPRQLYQFTTHSLRHTAGNMIVRSHGPAYETEFLRHSKTSKYGSTGVYMKITLDEMRDALNECFGPVVEELKNREKN